MYDNFRQSEIDEMKVRAQALLQEKVNARYQKRLLMKREENEKYVEYRKTYYEEYMKTEHGKAICQKKSKKRQEIVKRLYNELTEQEKEELEDFYFNRPEGMEVDHVIPLSKGGRHHVSNLQYVTPRQNRKKASIINFDLASTN